VVTPGEGDVVWCGGLPPALVRRCGRGLGATAVVDSDQLRVQRRGLFVVQGGDGDELAEAPLAQRVVGFLGEAEDVESLCDAGLRGREGLTEGGGL